MGIFDALSIAPKAVDDILDKDDGLLVKVGGWINDQQLTDAETLAANAKTVADVQDFVKATLSESTERSKARRSIADKWITAHLAIILLFCIALPWNQEVAAQYLELATSNTMGWVTGAISVFHFGSYGLSRHNETKASKK